MSKIIVSTEKTKSNEKKSLIIRIKLLFGRIKQWFKKLKKPWKISILALLIIAVVVAIFFVLKMLFYTSPDEQLQKIAENYYKENIVPAEKRSTSYTLVLSNLQKIGYDVSSFEKAGCSLDSYAVIFLSNPKEPDFNKLEYRINTNLVDCE